MEDPVCDWPVAGFVAWRTLLGAVLDIAHHMMVSEVEILLLEPMLALDMD